MTPGADRGGEGHSLPEDGPRTHLEPRGAELHRRDFGHEIIVALPDGIVIVDAAGVLIDANPKFCALVGFDRNELVGLSPPFPFWPSEALPEIERAFAQGMAGQSVMFELLLCRRDGARFPALVHPVTVRDAQGNVECVFATVKDVTIQKQLEGVVRESEERWRSIAENPYDFVVIVDRDYKYTYVNHTAPGLVIEDLIGKATPFEFVAPAFHDTMRAAFERAFATGEATTYDIYVEVLGRWFSNIVGPIKTDGVVTAISILTRDVTDSKNAEQALVQSERRLRLAMEGGEVGIFDIDLGKGNAFHSPRMLEILGYQAPEDASTETRVSSLAERLHPDDRAETAEALRAAMTSSEPFDREYRVASESGYRWVHGRGRSLPGPGGTLHFSGCVSDITGRKDAEAQRAALEAQLRQFQKMDTLGRMAAGLAHDFNNLLVPILGNAELILGEAGLNSPYRSGLEDIIQASSRARELAGRILVFGRHSDEPPRPTRVHDIVREAVRFLRASAPKGVEIVENIDDGCPEILGIPGQIHQAVSNLCTNAYQALKGRSGRITVAVESAEIEAAFAHRYRMPLGQAVRIVVEDDGPGMTKEILDRAFEPFFTTKPPGEGSGLGLSLVHGIVTQHEGAIVARSVPGQGARFELYFPLHGNASPMDAARADDSSPPISSIKRRILCVDDDAVVLRVISQVFGRAGHMVTAVPSSGEALRRVRDQPVDFDVVVTDQTMPDLTGIELASQLYDVRRDLPVILLSGYAEASLTESAPPNVRLCLQKPLTANALLRAVERAAG
ncbi:MAG: PAS domain S-box protein [Polyangiaceae bacterium]